MAARRQQVARHRQRVSAQSSHAVACAAWVLKPTTTTTTMITTTTTSVALVWWHGMLIARWPCAVPAR
eukprot:2714417-Rhodomonas_salina.3